jgi:hypothetical protein
LTPSRRRFLDAAGVLGRRLLDALGLLLRFGHALGLGFLPPPSSAADLVGAAAAHFHQAGGPPWLTSGLVAMPHETEEQHQRNRRQQGDEALLGDLAATDAQVARALERTDQAGQDPVADLVRAFSRWPAAASMCAPPSAAAAPDAA